MIQAWTYDQLNKVRQYRPELVDSAIEKLLNQQSELWKLVVIGAYLDEQINLGKAAELLNMHRLELQAELQTQGIPLRLGVDTIEEADAEFVAIQQWNSTA